MFEPAFLKNQEKPIGPLPAALFKVLVFFDSFDYPLTVFEAWRLVGMPAEYSQVEKILSEAVLGQGLLSQYISRNNGYYFLKGRDEIAVIRQKTAILAEERSRIARKVIRFFSWVPGFKAAAICNNFYYHQDSDIDLFIITAAKRLYIARALITLCAHLSGFRRHGENISRRVCLSFFVAEDGWNLSQIAIPGGDPYLDYWFIFLDPLWGERAFQNFWDANYDIVSKFPNASIPVPAPSRVTVRSWLGNIIRPLLRALIFGPTGNLLELIASKIQKRRMAKHELLDPNNEITGVIITDQMLKFHERDRRREFREKFLEHLDKLA